MSTRTTNKKTVHSHTTHQETHPMKTIADSTPISTEVTSAETATGPKVSPTRVRRAVAVALPPPVSVIPSPKPGFTPVVGGFALGVRPRVAEVVAMPEAVDELRNFVDWQVTLGKAAPTQAEMIAVFDAASQWSVMRDATQRWGAYCSNEEGMAWLGVRACMTVVMPLLNAALAADPSLATSYPKLCALFGAKSSIARKGASTKTANKRSHAAGEPATHGAIGKKRQRAAAKAALAEKQAAPLKPAADTPSGASNGNGTNGSGNGGNGSNVLAHS
jgi:hypothetical protein